MENTAQRLSFYSYNIFHIITIIPSPFILHYYFSIIKYMKACFDWVCATMVFVIMILHKVHTQYSINVVVYEMCIYIYHVIVIWYSKEQCNNRNNSCYNNPFRYLVVGIDNILEGKYIWSYTKTSFNNFWKKKGKNISLNWVYRVIHT